MIRRRNLLLSGIAFLICGGMLFLILRQTSSKKTTENRSKAAPAAAQNQTFTPTPITTYLPNPGIGWQEAEDFAHPLLPETVAYRRPQYAWRNQNPNNGVYDWSAVDADLNTAIAQKKQFSLRIYSMKGEGFGGEQLPDWVKNEGAKIFPDGEPDYSNCIYQQEWSRFVDAMRQKYDGNPNIAFIDISGYGNFNEWSYQTQTEFDADPLHPTTIDGQARKRLADMFIGGSGTTQCRNSNGSLSTVSYNYPGFQKTQLLMPFAGIRQSTMYVFSRRQDVGFRHDCLGRAGDTDFVMNAVGNILQQLWPHAPVGFEFCGDPSTTPTLLAEADKLLKAAHGSIAHDNFPGTRSASAVAAVLNYAGYRYLLSQAICPNIANAGDVVNMSMNWQNIGYAPNYPKMGQTFALFAYLVDSNNQTVQQWPVTADTTQWLPAANLPGTPPTNIVNASLPLLLSVAPGNYTLKVAIIDTRTNLPINLSFQSRDDAGRYPVCPIAIGGASPLPTASPSVTPSPTPSVTPTPSVSPSSTPTPSPSTTPTPSPSASPSMSPSPTPSPSSSPSSSPMSSASPTPSPGDVPVCQGLLASNLTPHVGDAVMYTCALAATATRYEFHYQVNNGLWANISPVTFGSNISLPLLVSPGVYQVQCRACNDAGCSGWTQ